MEQQEYTDGYQPQHPELIPGNRTEAHLWITAAVVAGVRKCDTMTFLKAWWAFAWLNPGFHPDDFHDLKDLPHATELTAEAFRRAEAGEIQDDTLYATEATHNAVWLERNGSPYAPSGFTDGYIPRHPELIPADEADARQRFGAIAGEDLSGCPKDVFLKAWWAFTWLNPGINPEYDFGWDDDAHRIITEEAFCRYKAGELEDDEMFPCEASHARALAERNAGKELPHDPYDRRVVIRTDDGRYLSRDGGATQHKRDAARYFMISDKVADQIEAVRNLYGREMSVESGI
jgi:hypothetical protein